MNLALQRTGYWVKDRQGNHRSVCPWPPDERDRMAASRLWFAKFLYERQIITDWPRKEVVPAAELAASIAQ